MKKTVLQANKLMTKKEAAEYLNCSVITIVRKANSGDIKGYKKLGKWYFKPSDLDAYIFS
jgi:excisionase family DNA binding protein